MNYLKYIAGVLVVLVVIGGYFYPKLPTVFGNAASPSGSTFGDSKIAFTSWFPASNAATSTSMLNTDGNDRIINTLDYWCSSLTSVNGAPLTSTGWIFTAATTSVANQGLQGSTNYVLSTTVATTTAELWVSSSTPGNTSTVDYRRWAPNTYLTINSNASSTANCTIGISYRGT